MAPHTPAIKQFAWQQLQQPRQQQCRLLAKLSGQRASHKFGHSWSMESRQVASDKNVAIVRLVVAVVVWHCCCRCKHCCRRRCCRRRRRRCRCFVIMHIVVAAVVIVVVVAAALHAVAPAARRAIKEALPYSHTASEKVQRQQQVAVAVATCNLQQHAQTRGRRVHQVIHDRHLRTTSIKLRPILNCSWP